jgi:hypothetical protein
MDGCKKRAVVSDTMSMRKLAMAGGKRCVVVVVFRCKIMYKYTLADMHSFQSGVSCSCYKN